MCPEAETNRGLSVTRVDQPATTLFATPQDETATSGAQQKDAAQVLFSQNREAHGPDNSGIESHSYQFERL